MDNFKAKKDKVSITLDSDTIETIKSYAEYDDRSFSQYINMVLKSHIRRKENKQKI
jgi:predicted DNA binding CopG/RHH family protein